MGFSAAPPRRRPRAYITGGPEWAPGKCRHRADPTSRTSSGQQGSWMLPCCSPGLSPSWSPALKECESPAPPPPAPTAQPQPRPDAKSLSTYWQENQKRDFYTISPHAQSRTSLYFSTDFPVSMPFPRCPQWPTTILPRLLPVLHSIAISRDAFTPKGMGLMVLCLLLCNLLLRETHPCGPSKVRNWGLSWAA